MNINKKIFIARSTLFATTLLVVALEGYGLNHLTNDDKRENEKTPAVVIALVATIGAAITYGTAAVHGKRIGYTRAAFPVVERYANDDLRRKLATPRYRDLNQTMIDLEDLPPRIAKQKSVVATIVEQITALQVSFDSQLDAMEAEQFKLKNAPSPSIEVWPPDQRSLYYDHEDRLQSLERKLAATRSARKATEEEGL